MQPDDFKHAPHDSSPMGGEKPPEDGFVLMPGDAAGLLNWLHNRALPLQQRQEALLGLWQHGLPEVALPQLETLALNTQEPLALRGSVVVFINKMAAPEAAETLLTLANEDDSTLKTLALEGLGLSKSPKALPVLLQALTHPDNQVFQAAAHAVGKLGQFFPLEALVVEALSDLLAAAPAFKAFGDDARCVAAWQLGELETRAPKALMALTQTAQTTANTELSALCLWALGEIGEHSPEVLKVLNWGKTQASPDIRLRAEMALKKVVRHVN